MLVERLFDGPIDVVGDVHGEFEALMSLITALGYNEKGLHPEGRRLVFSGDLVDRGPYSPSVLMFVMNLVASGVAQMVAGNHELNFLKQDYHEGTGWSYWSHCPKEQKFEPCEKASADQLQAFHAFLNTRPLVLVNDRQVVVHASYSEEGRRALETCPEQTILEALAYFQKERAKNADFLELEGAALKALALFDETDDSVLPPEEYHDLLSRYYYVKQILNPVSYTTSGLESKVATPFYIGGKWRFVKRDAWWQQYVGDKEVIVGHYWRTPYQSADFEKLFHGVKPYGWMAPRENVFCIDYSVGRRYQDRIRKLDPDTYTTTLCALRLPEKVVITEKGRAHKTLS